MQKHRLSLKPVTAIAAACSLTLLLVNHRALAEDTPTTANKSSVAPQNSLDEIVVTAERRESSLQKTPLAITVISPQLLERTGITDTKALLSTVPGLSVAATSANTNLGIRGLASGGGNAFTDVAVAFNVGGVSLARPYGVAAPFYDVARIEVLKGPQGTLYGRNATVGAINVVPNRPSDFFEGAASITAGNYGQINTTGMINGPLADKIAGRIAFQTVKHDGYLNNGLNDAKNQAVRAGLTFDPSSDLSFYVGIDYFHDNSRGAGTIYLYPNGFNGQRFQNPGNPWETLITPPCGNPALCPTFGNSGITPAVVQPIASLPVIGNDAYTNNTVAIYSGEMNWKLGFATLTVIPAQVETKVDFLGYGQGFQQRQRFDVDQTSLEARLASSGNSDLQWLAGFFYFKEKQKGASAFSNPRYYADITINSLTDENYALFGQTTYSVTKDLRATVGLRYTTEEKNVSGYGSGAPADANPATPECNATSLAAGAIELPVGPLTPVGACRFPTRGNKTFTDKSFRLGIEYDLAPRSLLFANASSAFKAGGFYNGLPPNTYLPEKLTAYQIGSKNKFMDGCLLLNLEAFYWKYRNQQISVFQTLNPPQLTAPVPVNVPGYVRGGELEASWLFTPEDLISANVLYAEGKYDLFPTSVSPNGTVGGLVNAPRANLPRWSSTVSYQHTFNLAIGKVVFGAKTHFETDAWLSPNRTTGTNRESYSLTDLSLDYATTDDRWSVTLFVTNVGNKAVLYSGTSGGVTPGLTYRPPTNPNSPFAAIGAPRTWGVRVGTRF